MVEAPVQPVFSSESAANELTADRPVRVSGFIALGLGLLSSCTIFSKAFLPLPVLTLIVAAIALRPSDRGVPVGRLPAYVGAVLAVFFGSWGWFQATTREETLKQHASRFAEYWVTTLQQGDVELALELARPPSMRQSERMPLEMYYQRNEEAREKLKEFAERPTVAMIRAGGESLRWELAQAPSVLRSGIGDEVAVRLKETSGMIRGVIQVDLVREPRYSAESEEPEVVDWFVMDFQHIEDSTLY